MLQRKHCHRIINEYRCFFPDSEEAEWMEYERNLKGTIKGFFKVSGNRNNFFMHKPAIMKYFFRK
jgi:hypothetical protein